MQLRRWLWSPSFMATVVRKTNACDIKTHDVLDAFADTIVSDASHIPRSLFCPFCANEYMFDFTLKDHLKRFHPEELEERMTLVNNAEIDESEPNTHLCPFCGAILYLIGLLPKHIANFHGSRHLQTWRHMSGNLLLMVEEKENESSILYASCSPGLSDIFDKLGTDEKRTITDRNNDNQQIKSILKKTPSKSSRIISSPSGVAIRRSRSELVKRSASVRRELRFDLPPLQKTPEQSLIEKYSKCLDFRKLFQIKKKNKRVRSPKKKVIDSPAHSQEIITSTPINFLDDDCDTKSIWDRQGSRQPNIRPLLFGSERFQCARCKERYASNGDLRLHLKDSHSGVKNVLRPHYQCGQCGIKFFRNSCLLRHCRFQHTPKRMRI